MVYAAKISYNLNVLNWQIAIASTGLIHFLQLVLLISAYYGVIRACGRVRQVTGDKRISCCGMKTCRNGIGPCLNLRQTATDVELSATLPCLWPSGGESRRMESDVVSHEGRDEIVGMVIARLHAQRQRLARRPAGRLEQPWTQA